MASRLKKMYCEGCWRYITHAFYKKEKREKKYWLRECVNCKLQLRREDWGDISTRDREMDPYPITAPLPFGGEL